MIGYLEPGIFSKLLISFLAVLNSMVYGLVGILTGLFTEISNVTLFSDSIIQEFTQRIYVVLGIYMLFKLAISLLNSVINPDHLFDKEKGMQKIIPRTVIALAMLILVPSVFSIAFEYQNKIALAVPKIIIGRGSNDNMADQGEILAATALKAFFQPTESTCKASAETQLSGTNSVSYLLTLPTQVCDNGGSDGGDIYYYEFNGFVGLAAGIFMVVSLASYCVDIAIRSIKLGLLQLLAPIPIISYIDPKSEKDGAFGHWTKECVSTYLEVFIKLGILYFVIFILSQIATDSGELLGGNASTASAWVKVFLIIGAFFFMGKAADFICNIIGVKPPKEKGGFFKGLAGIAGLGATAAAGISRGVVGARAGATSAAVRGKGKVSQVGAALRGALAGSTAGLLGGANAMMHAKPGENVSGKINQDVYKRNAARMAAGNSGATWTGRMASSMQRAILGEDASGRLKRELDTHKSHYENSGKLLDYAMGEGAKKKSHIALNTTGNSAKFGNTTFTDTFTYDDYIKAWGSAKQNGLSTFNVGGVTLDTYGSEANFVDGELKKKLAGIYYATESDEKIISMAQAAGITLPANANDFSSVVKGQKDSSEKAMLRVANELERAKANSGNGS